MIGGIRPGIWLAAAVALVAALAFSRLAAPTAGDESNRQPTRPASLDRSEAPGAAGSIGVHPAAALLPSPSRPAPERVEAPSEAPLAARAAGDPERQHPADSRAAADLRIAEAEAARRVESLGLAPAGARAAPSTADGARESEAADQLLVDYLMQDAYRGTEFPVGYPAEERTRAAAESQVRGLTPELRQSMLEVALETAGAERVGPRFDASQLWEGLIH